MKVCVLFNPQAGSARLLPVIRQVLDTDPAVTLCPLAQGEDLREVAARVGAGDWELLVVAGGDGTVHAVVSGLVAGHIQTPLAILPLGTGNDFCRTLEIPLDPLVAVELLRKGKRRRLDVARVEGDFTGYMVNAATGGFAGMVASEVTSTLKAAWGPLAYLRGAWTPVTSLPSARFTLRLDGGPPERFVALNIVIANGRTAAGGLLVAPTANPEDGLLDVVLVQATDTLDLSLIAARLLHGNYLQDENVIHRRAARVEIEATEPMPFSIDGEITQAQRLTFQVLPHALTFVTGADYQADPAQDDAIEEEPEHEPATVSRGLGQRFFGLLAGLLLLAKRTPRIYVAGLALVAVSLLIFSWLAAGVSGGRFQEFNNAATAFFRAPASPTVDAVAQAISYLGGLVGTGLIVCVLLTVFLGRKQYMSAATLLAVLVGILLLEAILKPLFAIAGPNVFGEDDPTPRYSFPSGHALRAVGLFGFIASHLIARASGSTAFVSWIGSALCIALAAVVCWSRVELGIQTATDVAAGAVAAAAILVACLMAQRYAKVKWQPKKSPHES